LFLFGTQITSYDFRNFEENEHPFVVNRNVFQKLVQIVLVLLVSFFVEHLLGDRTEKGLALRLLAQQSFFPRGLHFGLQVLRDFMQTLRLGEVRE